MDRTEIKKGDRVKTIYGNVETVVCVIHPMVYMSTANMPGGGYHHTKVFKITEDAAKLRPQVGSPELRLAGTAAPAPSSAAAGH